MRVSKRKIKKYLFSKSTNINTKKYGVLYKGKDSYKEKFEVAIEEIQDFLNCDPMHVGILQGDIFTIVYYIDDDDKCMEKLISKKQKEIPQKDWAKGYKNWRKTQ